MLSNKNEMQMFFPRTYKISMFRKKRKSKYIFRFLSKSSTKRVKKNETGDQSDD